MIMANVLIKMSCEAIAAFYSKPSGVQSGGWRAMFFISRIVVPLWKTAKDKICEKAVETSERLCDSKQIDKVAEGVRSLGDRAKMEDPGGSISTSKVRKHKPKHRKRKRAHKVRFTDDDDDDSDRPRHKRSRSHIGRALGGDSY